MSPPRNNSSETNVLEDASGASSFVDEALSLTKEFVHRFWNGEVAWCVDRLAEDFLWIGAQEDQSIVPRDEFRRQMVAITRTRPRVVLANERYVPIVASEAFCVTAGSYLGFSDPSTGQVLAQEQRFTFVWDVAGPAPKIRHYHVSNPLQIAADDESFPTRMGRQTYRYVEAILRQRSRQDSIVVHDVQGIARRVQPDGIVFAEARKQHTLLHCANADIVLYGCMGSVLNQLKLNLVRVHRSFAVNPRHVERLDKRNLVMDDGSVIEIPTKRLAQAKADLLGQARPVR